MRKTWDLSETHPLLIDQPDGLFFKLFGVTPPFRYDTLPGALSRVSDVSTISRIDQLTPLDAQVPQEGVRYVRYMDDILVLAHTRWKLRRAIRVVKQGLSALGLTTHPDKTWVGKAEQGFDFLGVSCEWRRTHRGHGYGRAQCDTYSPA